MKCLFSCIFAGIYCLAIGVAYGARSGGDADDLRKLSHDYYRWRDDAYPVATSSSGDHRADGRLTDYRLPEVLRRRQHVAELLVQVQAIDAEGWSKDDRIDRVLFQSQLAGADFFARVLTPEESDPQVYVNECSNAIFSLLQKDYAPHRTRAIAATARDAALAALHSYADWLDVAAEDVAIGAGFITQVSCYCWRHEKYHPYAR